MARRRTRCSEDGRSTPTHRQVRKQAATEGQDEESTKALDLTVPPPVQARIRPSNASVDHSRLNHATHRPQPIPAWLVDPPRPFADTQPPVVLGRTLGASRGILVQAEASSAESSAPRPLLRGMRSTMGPRGTYVCPSLGLSLPPGEQSWRRDTPAAAALMAHRRLPKRLGERFEADPRVGMVRNRRPSERHVQWCGGRAA